MPATIGGQTHLFTRVDRVTKWPEAVPLHATTVKAVLVIFLAIWVSWYGVPAIITSDKESLFTSLLLSSYCKQVCTHYITSLPRSSIRSSM